jgi:tetratricopeptide (TPR) repeat protein
MSRYLLFLSCVVLLAACSSASSVQEWHGPSPEQLVAGIRGSGAPAPGELDVQPLRDPMVEDLRAQATRFEQQKQYADAASALDKALAISPEDPALMQERAEVAVLQKDLDMAGALARSAYALGAKVGPLCRRHWATIRQQLALRQRRLELPAGGKRLKGETLAQWERDQSEMNVAIAEAARHQSDCTLTGPPRY